MALSNVHDSTGRSIVWGNLLGRLWVGCERLKGQCHEIFDHRFFSLKHLSWAPD
jgi:hypothetical protein